VLNPREDQQRRALRAMKLRATGLLVLAAVVTGLTFLSRHGDGGWVGFVRAGAEAAMVGGFADWFAVTALFRHPLHLPIPHTALIPRRKDDLGRTLGAFMQENFLSAEVVVTRLRSLDVVRRVGGWFADTAHAELATTEAAGLVRVGLEELRRDELEGLALAATTRLAEPSYAPVAGRLLEGIVTRGSHRPAFEVTARMVTQWLVDNPELILRTVRDPIPGFLRWAVSDARLRAMYERVVGVARAVVSDPDHELRDSVDALLIRYARAWQADGDDARAFDASVRSLLQDPEAPVAAAELIDHGLAILVDLVEEPGGELRRTVREYVVKTGQRARDDAEFNGRLTAIMERFAVHVTQTYADVFIRFITDTVADWDAAEATRRIELNVGRDLQYIRINGTVVGAVAGLVIHAVTLVL
jgi:uncharacterized membrane-anchored protein YjiN (DUF445 family)